MCPEEFLGACVCQGGFCLCFMDFFYNFFVGVGLLTHLWI